MVAIPRLALLAGLAIAAPGNVPDRLTGSILAIGVCLVGAVILHFAAP